MEKFISLSLKKQRPCRDIVLFSKGKQHSKELKEAENNFEKL